MKKQGFTLIELLVVIAIIAVLMGILMPALARAREEGKRAACMGNLKQLQMAWIMYADENRDRIPFANPRDKTENGQHELGWVVWEDNPSATEKEKLDGLKSGSMYKFCPNVKSYRCPTGERGEVVTYAITDAMNGYYDHPWSKNAGLSFKIRSRIKRPVERMVFIDEGRLSSNSWTIWYNKPAWWDQVTNRHSQGTDISFADGHSEYVKFSDPRTIEVTEADPVKWQGSLRSTAMATQPGNEDLMRVQRAAWGKLGYAP
jgi:prepilin-type N-terminal cleavage/methylation domain-containing protein/prepilin-type processing-associated H-X9-DG protein